MRTDACVTDDDPGLGELPQECPAVAQLVELFKTAFPINWEQLLRRHLDALGVAEPADLTPSKLAKFRDHVFWSVKQTSIKDPAAWISHQAAQVEPKVPALKLQNPVQVEDPAGQPKSVGRDPAALKNSPAMSPGASVRPSVSRTALYGPTKAQVLSRAKAAIEAGASPRAMSGWLACAREDFHASQREIGRAIGRSASWVNRLLKWRQSEYSARSPFGPTTRAGRAAHRSAGINQAGGCGGAEQPKDDGTAELAGHSAPTHETASLTPPNEILLSASPQTEVLLGGEAAKKEADGIEEVTMPLENGGEPSQKQTLSARKAKLGQKLSPERMRIVIEALRESPILSLAAAEAGIHRRTLERWLKCSKAGQDGYDIEWEGFPWRFHEACEVASEEPPENVLAKMYDRAMGPVIYKVDQDLVAFGLEGADAYATDDNGDFIVEGRAGGSVKMLRHFLVYLEKCAEAGKRRSSRSGGVLVIGKAPRRSDKSYAASTKARQWKSALRKLRETND